jgi:hypothetical protein
MFLKSSVRELNRFLGEHGFTLVEEGENVILKYGEEEIGKWRKANFCLLEVGEIILKKIERELARRR